MSISCHYTKPLGQMGTCQEESWACRRRGLRSEQRGAGFKKWVDLWAGVMVQGGVPNGWYPSWMVYVIEIHWNIRKYPKITEKMRTGGTPHFRKAPIWSSRPWDDMGWFSLDFFRCFQHGRRSGGKFEGSKQPKRLSCCNIFYLMSVLYNLYDLLGSKAKFAPSWWHSSSRQQSPRSFLVPRH